jgi:hypothetical protein
MNEDSQNEDLSLDYLESLGLPEPIVDFLLDLQRYNRSTTNDFFRGYTAGRDNHCLNRKLCSDVFLLGESFGIHSKQVNR